MSFFTLPFVANSLLLFFYGRIFLGMFRYTSCNDQNEGGAVEFFKNAIIGLAITILVGFSNQVIISVNAGELFTPTEDDIKTWRYGKLILPGSSTTSGVPLEVSELLQDTEDWAQNVKKHYLKPDAKVPIVLYLHSCGGNDHYSWSGVLSEWGFGVISPNSFARDGRFKNCGTMPGPKLFKMRMAELRYALQQIKKVDWIDQTRLILMGHSEGSFFPPAYSENDFTAHIVLAGNCRFSGLHAAPCCGPGYSKAPKHVAVLNIIGDGDKWNEWPCHETHKTRGSRFVQLRNHGHNIYSTSPKALGIMATFLETCCGKESYATASKGLDALELAKNLFNEFGGMATMDAQLKADDAASKGDLKSNELWLNVLREIEKLID
jgi:dienelactone hydrolase